MREIVAYHCDYCRKYSRSEQYMKKHEIECYYNSNTRSCGTCGNLYNKGYPIKIRKGIQATVNLPECSVGYEISNISKHPKSMLCLRTSCDSWIPRPNKEEVY